MPEAKMRQCKCDECKKVIYTEPSDPAGGRKVRYYNITTGTVENNRKRPKVVYDICSVDCALKFTEEHKDILSNPFTGGFIEIVPIEVIGEVEEA